MYHELKSKSPLGKIQLLNKVNSVLEEYSIGVGRLSITPKKNFFLLNFWVRAEYDIKTPDGKSTLVWGPTLEILTKIPEKLDTLEIKVPVRTVIINEWDTNYRTGYYNGWHNFFDDAELKIEKTENNVFKVKFSGSPDEDERQVKIAGECLIQLSTELKRYW